MRQLPVDLSGGASIAGAQAAKRHDAEPAFTVNARYSFEKWYDSEGQLREFSCRLVGISPHEMAMVVPVIGRPGASVTVECEEFGQLEGVVSSPTRQGFTMKIKATDEERAKLADKIAWHEKFYKRETTDQRKHKRIVPNNPLSTIILADGSCIRCFVIDMSVSGVAVSADIVPELRMPLAVGKVVGRVARHLAGGFAVEFVQEQDIRSLERMIIQSPR